MEIYTVIFFFWFPGHKRRLHVCGHMVIHPSSYTAAALFSAHIAYENL